MLRSIEDTGALLAQLFATAFFASAHERCAACASFAKRIALESNCDGVWDCRLKQVEHTLAEAQQEAAASAAAMQEARREAAARMRDAEDAGSLAVAAQEAADAAVARERAARAAAGSAEAALNELRG